MPNHQTRAGRPRPIEFSPNIEQRMNVDFEDSRVPSLLNEAAMNTWDPFGNTDTTIHLTLDVEDDLDLALENLSRLSRLGDFTSARALFHETLENHLDKPQVLIRWTETLLRQGDYKSLLSIDRALLRIWELTVPILKPQNCPSYTGDSCGWKPVTRV